MSMQKQTLITNRYQLLDELGAGGMGTVFKGLDTQTDTLVAIKQLKPELTSTELIERFKREGEALRDLNHPNIVKMVDALEHNGQHYLVMEYVASGDLRTTLQNGKMPTQQVLTFAIDLADALTRAHKLDIIHRDLKPANVLIGEDGVLRLTDFGVAHVGSKERVTNTDAIVGTIDYLPPESFGNEPFDIRGDIWAFGVMLFEMLSGTRPFKGKSIVQVIQNITTQPIPDLEELQSDLPVDLIDLVYRMLERNPDARISSVRHVGAVLEDIVKGRTSMTPVQGRFETPVADVLHRPKHNLPAQTTPFVGRESELAELAKLLEDSKLRLMTILAPGGMGKTRLALEIAGRFVGENMPSVSPSLHDMGGLRGDTFPDGVYFVELAPLTLPDQMIPAIASALDFSFQQDDRDQKQQVCDLLREKHLLLVMDNFEHLMNGVGLVTEILNAAPQVQILATSRQRLGQPGEILFHLGGMKFPDWETPEDALEYAAVKLFMNSAQRAQPGFELTSDNLDYVARICRLVQGMPLGIVLAGAWLAMLSPEEITAELSQNIDFLADESGEVPERQQSIRAVMNYSWQMMNEAEQAVFMKLSVFRKGFTREAAQEVAGANLRILMGLVNNSLIRRHTDSGRYEIHELLRQYAQEKLQESDESTTTYDKHAAFYSTFLAEELPFLKGGGQIDSIEGIKTEYDNCYAAWEWAIERKQSDTVNKMIDSLYLFMDFHYWSEAGTEMFQRGREQWSVDSAEAPLVAGRLSVRFPGVTDSEVLNDLLERGLAIAEKHNNLEETAFCLRELGLLWGHRTSREADIIHRGLEFLEASIHKHRERGDRFYEAQLLDDIGWCHERLLDTATRGKYSKQSIEMRKEVGDVIGLGLSTIGYAGGLLQSEPQVASQLLEDTYQISIETRNPILAINCRMMMGTFALSAGDLDLARTMYDECLTVSNQINHEQGRIISQLAAATITSLQGLDLEKANQLLQNALPDDSLMYTDYGILIHGSLAYMCYSASIGDFEQLGFRLQPFWAIVDQREPTHDSVTILPFAALVLGHKGQKERAVSVLRFALSHEWASGLVKVFPEWIAMHTFMTTMREELGEEAYETAWEQGKSLELKTVLQGLRDELGASPA